MKFAYADPPYLGCAQYYRVHHPEADIWDDPETHRTLIERLCDEFPDGWVMSLRERGLRTLLPMCPEDARVGCWITENSRFANRLPVQRYFEPVIWRGGRPWSGKARCADWVLTKRPGTIPGTERLRSKYKDQPQAFLGRKPPAFCEWIFDLIGAQPGDDFHDLFPGSGAVSAAWAKRCGAQPDLPLTPLEKLVAERA
ncbi:MAG: hypothetical protein AAFR28_16700 [Pseudomonadota bacterium]